ncbi:MAG: hypothetical protein ACC647_07670 [Anaerolineales bacterium]
MGRSMRYPRRAGTGYAKACSGTPFVGIPMQSEQEDNLQMLVQGGSEIWISHPLFQERRLYDAIDWMFGNYDRYKENAIALRDSLPAARGAERAVDLIINL